MELFGATDVDLGPLDLPNTPRPSQVDEVFEGCEEEMIFTHTYIYIFIYIHKIIYIYIHIV